MTERANIAHGAGIEPTALVVPTSVLTISSLRLGGVITRSMPTGLYGSLSDN